MTKSFCSHPNYQGFAVDAGRVADQGLTFRINNLNFPPAEADVIEPNLSNNDSEIHLANLSHPPITSWCGDGAQFVATNESGLEMLAP